MSPVVFFRRRVLQLCLLAAVSAASANCGRDLTKPPGGPPPPARLVFLDQPSTSAAGAAFDSVIAVVIEDSEGHKVPTATNPVVLAITPGTGRAGAHLRGPLSGGSARGVASFSGLSVDSASSGYSLTATASGLTPATSSPFTVVPAPAIRLQWMVPPTNSYASAVIAPAPQVTLLDSLGNVATTPGVSVTVTIVSGTGTPGARLHGADTAVALAGSAIYPAVMVDSSGTGYRLIAAAAGLASATSGPFDVLPVPASRLVIDAKPASATAGSVLTPAVLVTLEDSLGRVVTSASNTVTIVITAGTGAFGAVLGGTVSKVAVNGQATFGNLTIDRPGGTYTLSAIANGFAPATSVAFDVRGVAVQVVGGVGHTCIRTDAGLAYCWGANAEGQVGDGSTTARTTPTAVATRLVFTALTAGGDGSSTCGLVAGDLAYCWGRDVGFGEGIFQPGPPPFFTTPTAVGGSVAFTEISTAGVVACGLSIEGAAYCWGDRAYGEVGDSSFYPPQAENPTTVSGGRRFVQISAGDLHACAVTSDGQAYCWGAAGSGQLGDSAAFFVNGWPSPTNTPWPLPVTGGIAFASVVASAFHTCGLTTAGVAFCWGDNSNFELGLGPGHGGSWPRPMAVAGGLTFAELVASPDQHTCGVTVNGAAYCWGLNSDGQLGDGTTTNRDAPVPVVGGLVFARIAVGDFFTCGVTAAGAAYCWGRNDWSQLGDGTTNSSSVPVRVRLF
jgi:alpha-tubulin suppressor-like RCC1 family protein